MQPDRGSSEAKNRARNYSLVLLGLLSIFFLRVFAQFLQAVSPAAFLPNFEAWQSGGVDLLDHENCDQHHDSIIFGKIQ